MRTIDQLLDMPIVTVEEGQKLGSLKGVEIDTSEGRIRYLHLKGAGRADGAIPWQAVRSVGSDAITVESKTAVMETVPTNERDALTSYVGDRSVVTESGERLGSIKSYDVDETSGEIRMYHVGTGGVLGRLTGREIRFPHHAVRTFGDDAIIVSDWVTAEKE